MINLRTDSMDNPTLIRVEAARVFIPGYEGIAFYATPALDLELKATEGLWHITEELTGMKIGGPDQMGNSIEDALEKATLHLRSLKVTPERFQELVDKYRLNKEVT